MAEGTELQPFSLKNIMYYDNSTKTSYTIPKSDLAIRKDYGLALVSAWKDLYLLFYTNQTGCLITKIKGFNENYDATVSEDKTNITIDFSYTVWQGIAILPF